MSDLVLPAILSVGGVTATGLLTYFGYLGRGILVARRKALLAKKELDQRLIVEQDKIDRVTETRISALEEGMKSVTQAHASVVAAQNEQINSLNAQIKSLSESVISLREKAEEVNKKHVEETRILNLQLAEKDRIISRMQQRITELEAEVKTLKEAALASSTTTTTVSMTTTTTPDPSSTDGHK